MPLDDDELRELLTKVRSMHDDISELKRNLLPAIETISRNGIASLLLGRKRNG